MIPLTLLQVHIQSEKRMDFGANPGSTLRGALYETLRVLYDDGSQARSRYDDTNPVAWLLRMEDNTIKGGDAVPRPLGIRPPLENGTFESAFGIAFYGKGQDYIQWVLSGLNAMQNVGIGRGRWMFHLTHIDQIDPISQQPSPLIIEGVQVSSLLSSPSAESYARLAESLKPDQLTVEFLTPTRIIYADKLSQRPIFAHWVGRLLSRVRKLSEVYLPEPIFVPFAELLPLAETITLVENDTHWRESWSGSRRDGEMRPTSGFVGRARYSGDLRPFMPYLLLGQSLQVGKNIVKGCGWYRIHYQWA